MTWFRLPLFVWSIYATSVILVLATPVLAITLLLLAVERLFQVGIFDPALGGDPLLFQHLFWFYSHPAVYIMILPGMGVVSEIIPCFARKQHLRLQVRRLGERRDRGDRLPRLGPPHVRRRHVASMPGMVFSFLSFIVAVPVGDQGVQLDRHAVQGLDLASTRRCSTRSASSACSRSAG